jgi:hypothetical protein
VRLGHQATQIFGVALSHFPHPEYADTELSQPSFLSKNGPTIVTTIRS